jgi:hypothetical protein
VELVAQPVLISEKKIGHERQIKLTIRERQPRQLSCHVTLGMRLVIREKDSGRAFA